VFRIATFNLENLDTGAADGPSLDDRLGVLRPQLLRLRADILCLQEINAQKRGNRGPRTFEVLDRLLAGTPYSAFERATSLGPAGKGPADKHNLVCLSRFPIEQQDQFRHDLVPPPRYRMVTATPAAGSAPVKWDRPVLCCSISLPDGSLLHVLNLHLKAPIAAVVPGQKRSSFVWRTVSGWAEGYYLAAMKRAGQALEARLVIDRLFDEDRDALIAVCGDFNADENEMPTRILRGEEEDTGSGALAYRALVVAERSVAPDQRYSVLHHGRPQMLDHMLVSRQLMAWYRGIEIHNEDLGDELVAYRSVRNPPDSYHAPVVATFADPNA
jgi:endonuclease/exonuclease/phosphatase family metal-dependent hydrolase